MRVLLVSEGASELKGALGEIVKRLAAIEIELESEQAKNIRASHGKGGRYFKKVIRSLQVAESKQCGALVFVIDEDGDGSRAEQLNDAQDYEKIAIKRACGGAIRTFDAWMLADEKALSNALGCSVAKQKSPEANRNPKADCEKMRNQGDFASLPDLYAAAAAYINLEVLEKHCPKGFAPFAARVKALASD